MRRQCLFLVISLGIFLALLAMTACAASNPVAEGRASSLPMPLHLSGTDPPPVPFAPSSFLINSTATPPPTPAVDPLYLTFWSYPQNPQIETMGVSIRETLRLNETSLPGLEGEIKGFMAAAEYGGLIFARDMATLTPTVQYLYPQEYLRLPLEEFLRRQYTTDSQDASGNRPGAGAVSGILAPDGHIDKATAVSDEETSIIHAAYLYYWITQDSDWLHKNLAGEQVIERLNSAMTWLFARRYDERYGLIKRGHTTDWGDIKLEAAANPTDLDEGADHWTASLYDQAVTYRALLELAEMNDAAGEWQRGGEWRQRAFALRQQANQYLWQPERGFYRLHLHLTPLVHPFAEEEMVSIANAVAAKAGLADEQQARSIFTVLEEVRQAAGASKAGVSLYPPYPEGTYTHPQMDVGEYQNGGLWDWWAGQQILAEFEVGFSELALTHLTQVAADWVRHPDKVYEWQIVESGQGWGAHHYAGAAGTMGQAIIEGMYGVSLGRGGVILQPRLGENDGAIQVYQPATGLYIIYSYSYDGSEAVFDYRTNYEGVLVIKLLLPQKKAVKGATMDGRSLQCSIEIINEDSSCVLDAPGGHHRLVLAF